MRRARALTAAQPIPGASSSSLEPDVDITVPNIGHFVDVLVIEVHVTAGDIVAAEDPLITLESDKATLDVPAPVAEQPAKSPPGSVTGYPQGTSSCGSTPRQGPAAQPPRR